MLYEVITWPEAEATCSAPALRPSMMRVIGLVMLRVIKKDRMIPTKTAPIPITMAALAKECA